MVAGSSKKGTNPGRTTLTIADVIRLLEANETARMLTVITTHCMDDTGQLVWGGDHTESMTCTMKHVCIAQCPLDPSRF